ncbi:hypothetical protein RND81_12G206600 [Saponaria officinalis]|uniref:Protein kinase domain-containing protein n=1 Tax=Saponaria officinalis TaxID=3572 RepID=A0AAW1HDA6_SAPOF
MELLSLVFNGAPSHFLFSHPITKLISYFLLFFYIFITQNVHAETNFTNWIESCQHLVMCHNLPPIVGFPFWGGLNNWRPKECGYPDMHITCDNGINATIMINGKAFEVVRIDPFDKTIVIARGDYGNRSCPKTFTNTTLDYRRYRYGPQTLNITALYGCSRPATKVVGQFKCPIKGVREKTAFYRRGVVNPLDYNCSLGVVVPIIDYLEPQFFTRSLISYVFRKGFNVNYTLNGEDDAFCKKYEENNPLVTLALVIIIALLVLNCRLFGTRTTQPGQASTERPQLTSLQPSPILTPSHPSPVSILEEANTYMGLRLFSQAELELATNNFNQSRKLGIGGFATVYYGKLEDGTEVAVKRFHQNHRNNTRQMGQFMNEVNILALCRHEHLVRLFGCTSRNDPDVLLVYEFVENGTVSDHIHGKKARTSKLSCQIRLQIATETAEALTFLHHQDVIHRDVKSSNILLDGTFRVKVADFGLERLFPEDATHVSTVPQGTLGYVDPQYHRLCRLTEKSDVYSFGVVLMELISSKRAVCFNRPTDDANLAMMAIDRVKKNARVEIIDPTLGYDTDPIVSHIVDAIVEIGMRCLHDDGAFRPKMQEVLDYLRNISIS